MKQVYRFLFKLFGILKVLSLLFGASYFVFWFYRYFDLPYADLVYPYFDILIFPIQAAFSTTKYADGKVIEMGYLVMGTLSVVLAVIFGMLESSIVDLDRANEIKTIRQRRELQDKINRELKSENELSLAGYKYFSILLKFKTKYASEVTELTGETPPNEILFETYINSATFIKNRIPSLNVLKHGKSIFIRGVFGTSFDNVVDTILASIKYVKEYNSKRQIITDFWFVVDAQFDRKGSDESIHYLEKLSNMEYVNKAIATLAFKTRFDLLQPKSKYQTDVLGWSVIKDDIKDKNEEIYLFKTKPKKIC